MKAAYQKYMRDVAVVAHQHFHEHVQRVRGSSSYDATGAYKAKPAQSSIKVDKAVKDAGG